MTKDYKKAKLKGNNKPMTNAVETCMQKYRNKIKPGIKIYIYIYIYKIRKNKLNNIKTITETEIERLDGKNVFCLFFFLCFCVFYFVIEFYIFLLLSFMLIIFIIWNWLFCNRLFFVFCFFFFYKYFCFFCFVFCLIGSWKKIWYFDILFFCHTGC